MREKFLGLEYHKRSPFLSQTLHFAWTWGRYDHIKLSPFEAPGWILNIFKSLIFTGSFMPRHVFKRNTQILKDMGCISWCNKFINIVTSHCGRSNFCGFLVIRKSYMVITEFWNKTSTYYNYAFHNLLIAFLFRQLLKSWTQT